MRRDYRRYFPAAALAVFVAVASMSNMRPLVASPYQNNPSTQDPGSSAASSVVDGVFTSAQATRGQQKFQIACLSCHTVAEHTGRQFTEKWVGTSVAEMFDLISNTMPDGDPGSLQPEDYASIIAFFLKETGYPEGKQELPARSELLKKLRIDPLAR